MLTPPITPLPNPDIIRTTTSLEHYGKLAISHNKLIYLDIDDAYIHRLFPLLDNDSIKKPDYFKEGGIGAHVSVVYPEEGVVFDKRDFGKEYHFKIKGLAIAEINVKKYYALFVESPMLRQLRTKYGLPEQLQFKNHWIDFHITIGVSITT